MGDAGQVSDGGASSDGGPSTHVLLFGGVLADGGILDDTWTWDGLTWTQHTVAGPSARWGSVGGALDGGVVLFGGIGVPDAGVAALGDTWIWNGASWTQRTVAGPSARGIAQGGAVGSALVLYGGYDLNGNSVNDTWTWDGSRWTQTIPDTVPGSSLETPAAAGQSVSLATAVYNDALVVTDGVLLWACDGGAWWPLNDGGNNNGSGYLDSASAATLDGKLVLFGGSSNGSDGQGTMDFDNTLIWAGSSWSEPTLANPPEARDSAGLVALGSSLLLFGGSASGSSGDDTVLGDTWLFDGGSWTELNVSGPGPRSSALMVAY